MMNDLTPAVADASRFLADFAGILYGFLHGSIPSKVGASSKPAAIHLLTPVVDLLFKCVEANIDDQISKDPNRMIDPV